MQTKIPAILSAALFAVGCAAMQAPAPPAGPPSAKPVVETLASYPHGAFLENLTIGRGDAITFTSYLDRSLQRIDGGAAPRTLAQLDVHPVGIVPLADGFLVTAHGKAFTEGPAFTATNAIVVTDAAGQVRRRYPAPDARFLNGAAITPDGRALIADSLAGVVWRFDPRTGALTEWLRDPQLAPDPAFAGFALGANGVKIHDGFVYVSNSSRQSLYRVALSSSGAPGGQVALVAKTGGIDDFDFGPDGSIYVATHQAALRRIAPSGAVETVLETGCDSCTSVAFRGHGAGRRLIVLTTGNFVEPGATQPARVLSVALPGAR